MTPARAMSPAFAEDADLAYWTGSRLERLDMSTSDLFAAAVPGDVFVALLRRSTDAPAWQRFMHDALGLLDFGTGSESLGAIVFCLIDDGTQDEPNARWVAWTFGSGSRAMRRFGSDPRFGLMAALNALAPTDDPQPMIGPTAPARRTPRLGNLQYRRTTPYFQQTGHRAARDIPVEGFPVDQATDVVAAAGGRSADPLLSRVQGGRSLRFRTEVEHVADFVKLAEQVVGWSTMDRYKDAFGWVDNIRPVDDEALIDRLREQLVVDFLADPVPPTLDVLLPDDLLDIGDERSIQYVLYPNERRESASRITLTIAMLSQLSTRSQDSARSSDCLDIELRFLDEAKEPVGTATILECLCADLIVDDEQYVAYDGDFYHVERGFVQGIDNQLRGLRESELALPCYRGGAEGDYNDGVGQAYPEQFAVLDRRLIRLPGEAGIEACDLIDATGTLVHVKRKGKSSMLSHLFLQAVNSCDTLRHSAEAREQLNEIVKTRATSQALATTALEALAHLENRYDELEVVFAFLGDWRERAVTSLPLFSRVSLVQAARRIGDLGYQVSVKLVDICRT